MKEQLLLTLCPSSYSSFLCFVCPLSTEKDHWNERMKDHEGLANKHSADHAVAQLKTLATLE